MRRPAALPAMLLAAASIAAACIAALLPAPAHAQTPAPAAKAKPVAKHVKASAKSTAKAPAKPVELPLTAASTEQLEAADRIYLGDYACEFNQNVQVARYDATPGYIGVRWDKQSWVMKPVLSSTGALRLEDVKGRALMIQIANKSMLMDAQAGRRLVDDCVHESQRAAHAAGAASGAEGIGIDPVKNAAIAAQAAATAAQAAATAADAAASAAQAAVQAQTAASAPR